ncbi:MAG: hypothetical protein Q8920_15190 [Bacillota bacterium]|nr:hypothetical protein [Bacillota bacterium]
MPWCPKCRTEYEGWVKKCSDCGEDLVDELEPEEKIEQTVYGQEAFLTAVSDDIQADLLESLLKAYGIPIRKSYRETGAYMKVYFGGARFGIDIYVPSDLLEQAQDILKSQSVDAGLELDDIEKSDFDKLAMDYEKKRVFRSRLLLFWLFLLPIGFVIIVTLIHYLKELF